MAKNVMPTLTHKIVGRTICVEITHSFHADIEEIVIQGRKSLAELLKIDYDNVDYAQDYDLKTNILHIHFHEKNTSLKQTLPAEKEEVYGN